MISIIISIIHRIELQTVCSKLRYGFCIGTYNNIHTLRKSAAQYNIVPVHRCIRTIGVSCHHYDRSIHQRCYGTSFYLIRCTVKVKCIRHINCYNISVCPVTCYCNISSYFRALSHNFIIYFYSKSFRCPVWYSQFHRKCSGTCYRQFGVF